jgi:sulfite reductase beta subunit-like hemoprotein
LSLAELADRFGDERLYLTRNQNAMLRNVGIDAVSPLKESLDACGLGLEGADQAGDVRVCTGGPVCSLALTPAPRVGADLLDNPALRRNSSLRVHVSGCPNACAQHQIADVGFSYQVWLGGDLRAGGLGEVVGRVAERDVSSILSAIVGVWEALRERRETLGDTVARVGLDALQAQIASVFRGRWEPGPEPAPARELLSLSAHRVPMVVGA